MKYTLKTLSILIVFILIGYTAWRHNTILAKAKSQNELNVLVDSLIEESASIEVVLPTTKPKLKYFFRGANNKHWLYDNKCNEKTIYGIASYYSSADSYNTHTSTNMVFDENMYTAASPYLPLPTIVRVTNLENDKSILVIVNDRGITHKRFKKKPKHLQRHIDLSKKAMEDLNPNYTQDGILKVKIEVIPLLTKQYRSFIKSKYDVKYYKN